MKTTVSIPDELFRRAGQLARRLRVTRSDVYRRALVEYLWRHSPDDFTTAMNRVVADVGAEERFGAVAAYRVLQRSEW